VDGAIAASAPILGVLYMDPPFNINSFQQIETQDATPYGGANAHCVPNVRNGFANILNRGASSDGRKKLSVDFRLCTPLQTVNDIYQLVWWLKNSWDFMAMGDYPYPSDYLTNGLSILPAYPVRVACNYLNMTNPDETTLNQAMREASAVFYNISGNLRCFDLNQDVNNETKMDGIYWDYLYCTHILLPTGQDGENDMFWNDPFDLEATVKDCYERWGVITRPEWISETYGGYNSLLYSSNILFSNGDLDPWSGAGVTKNVGETISSVIISGGAHHLDLMFSNPLDPPSVKLAREIEKGWIEKWISQKKTLN